MLSETEVHYLVGFLYLHTRRTDVSVEVRATLGDKVYDQAAAKSRDVDVVIVAAGSTAVRSGNSADRFPETLRPPVAS